MPTAPLARALGLLPLLLAALAASAQPTPGDCAEGQASVDLGAAESGTPAYVRARVFNTGALYWSGGDPIYIVPPDETVSSIFAAGLWLSGRVDGEMRVAAARYGNYEFWPGPLGEGAVPPDDCAAYDRIWRVSRGDVTRYIETGVATPDLAEWPAHLGAPTFDGDGDPTTYDLTRGDHPAITGDEMAWWVMNDVGNEHLETGSAPLGVEVRAAVSGFAAGAVPLLTSTFYRYEITNRSARPITDAYVTYFADVDLGNEYSDDYVGVDTTLGLGYTYNADNEDVGGYGEAPPAVGAVFLQAPSALADPPQGRGLVSSFGSYYGGSGPDGDPGNATEYARLIRGYWRDGQPFTVGGMGRGGTEPTRFVFPGDPTVPTFWSERCTARNCSQANAPDDRRWLLSLGPFTLTPGQTETVEWAVVWARGEDHLDSVTRLKAYARGLIGYHEIGGLEPMRVEGFVPPPPPPNRLARAARPTPASTVTTIDLSFATDAVARLAVYDALGRIVAVPLDGPVSAGTRPVRLDVSAWPAGLYVYRLTTRSGADATGRIVVAR